MTARRGEGGRYVKREIDGSIGGFKDYPVYIPPRHTRPLHPGHCEVCTPGSSTFKTDSTSQTLALVNILGDKSCLNLLPNNTRSRFLHQTAVWLSTLYLKSMKKSVIIQPGQFEVMHRSIEGGFPLLVLLTDQSATQLLSICVALLSSGFASITATVDEIKTMDKTCLLQLSWLGVSVIECPLSGLSDLLGRAGATDDHPGFVETMTDGNSRVFLARNTKGLLSHLTQDQINEELVVTQAVMLEDNGSLRIDLDFPFSLKQFIANNSLVKSIPQSLEGHLNYSRLILGKPSLKECLNFLLDFSNLVGENESITHKIGKLREVVRSVGGDLGFSGETEAMVGAILKDIPHGFQDSSIGTLGLYFYPASVMAVSVLSLLPGPIRVFRGNGGMKIHKGKLLDRAEDLYRLLGLERVCQRPCESFQSKLTEGLSWLEGREVISAAQQSSSSQTSAILARRLAQEMESESDEESGFYEEVIMNVATDLRSIEILEELADILRDKITVMYVCLLKLPDILLTGSLRTKHFKNSSMEHMTAVCGVMLGYAVEADIEDVDDQIQAIVKAGVLDEMIVRGESWLAATDSFSTQQDITPILELVAKYII